VSVLTPTYNRRKFIPTAIACFKDQSYPHDSMEWIILDDGTDKVGDLFTAAKDAGLKNIRYVAIDERLKIGAKRNRLNALAKGDICVCMDDDDYYPPDRVKKAVFRLQSAPGRSIPVVGASMLFLYFADRDEIWSIGPYNQNHCTNGTMAYWTTYTKDHKYDETVDKAEEKSFMNDWKTPVLQLTPLDTMLVICHADNTFDKRVLLAQNNPLLKKQGVKMKQYVTQKKIKEFYYSLAAEYKAKPLPPPVIPIASDLPPHLLQELQKQELQKQELQKQMMQNQEFPAATPILSVSDVPISNPPSESELSAVPPQTTIQAP